MSSSEDTGTLLDTLPHNNVNLQERIDHLTEELDALRPKTLEEVEELRIRFLSRKGAVAELFEAFKQLAPEEKRALGSVVNRVKQLATERITQFRHDLEEVREVAHEDLTRTADALPMGSRHPLSLVEEEVLAIFTKLGFSIARGPEIEDDYHLFSALNFPPDHPARDMQDTFFIQQSPDILLRTHTSSVQIRVMEQFQPPIRVICPGRVYRNEAISARAHCFFHQAEALYVDKGVSFRDLRELLLFFAREYGDHFKLTTAPDEAARGADVLFTDVWTSMGMERETERRRRDFNGFCLDAARMALAKPDCIVQHPLPAHRGEEITPDVFETHADEIFDEAENRLHVEKAVLGILLAGK